jgi:hypothetical protein
VSGAVSHPRLPRDRGSRGLALPGQATRQGRRGWWVAAGVLAAITVVFVLVTRARPSYDAFGWLVWGHQVLHWNLNTDGAPSWKPLTFLFTLPYALTGHRVELWLWTLTAVLAAFAAAGFAGRIAYRLAPVAPGRPWTRAVAAVIAAVGLLGLSAYAHQVLITTSDPMIVAVCLAAIDCHLSGRYRLAFGLVWLAALGRPEAWAFAFGYAVWSWRAVPAMRPLAAIGLVMIPVCWFSVPALTSKSWLTPGDLALGQATVIHGSKFVGVFGRLRGLTGVPMQIAVLVSIVMAAIRRDSATLVLAGLGVLWAAIEIAFALHGWSAVPRYLMEPGAVLIVVAAIGIGHVLAYGPPGHPRLRWAGPLLILGLLAAMVPYTRSQLRFDHGLVDEAHVAQLQLGRLSAVVAADGGARAIRECGQPVSELGNQSTLAWELDMNVGNVGFKPGRSIDSGAPIVFFKLHDGGWIVHATHPAPGSAARCAKLDRKTAFS